MKESTKKTIFVWGATLIITAPIDFLILDNISWSKSWHARAVSILIAALFFGITRVIYDRLISSTIQKN